MARTEKHPTNCRRTDLCGILMDVQSEIRFLTGID